MQRMVVIGFSGSAAAITRVLPQCGFSLPQNGTTLFVPTFGVAPPGIDLCYAQPSDELQLVNLDADVDN